MNLQTLKYLAAVAKHCHFGKAAKSCFISQPTLSMQIKKLEEELGVQLVERTNKSVMLTEMGQIMAEHAANILQEVVQMQEKAKALRDPYNGQIRIGIIATLAPYLLPRVMPLLLKKFPHLKYQLIEGQTLNLLEKLDKAEIDSAILALPVIEKNLIVQPLFKEEFLLAVPLMHTLAKRVSVTEADLKGKNLLLLEEGHCLRDQALELCQQIDATEFKDFRATSLETLRHMVSAGMGITLMPKLACDKNSKLAYIPFKSKKPPHRMVGLVWRKTTAKAVLLNEISKVILINESKI